MAALKGRGAARAVADLSEGTILASLEIVAPPGRVLDAADSLAILLHAKGHVNSIAYDGLEAIAQAEANRPEIAFLDIGMPRMNGYEVAAAFRSSPDLAHAVLVALTGWGSHEDRLRALEAGFDHHLTKPASADALSRFFANLTTSNAQVHG